MLCSCTDDQTQVTTWSSTFIAKEMEKTCDSSWQPHKKKEKLQNAKEAITIS